MDVNDVEAKRGRGQTPSAGETEMQLLHLFLHAPGEEPMPRGREPGSATGWSLLRWPQC
jgi:hypothetical protein